MRCTNAKGNVFTSAYNTTGLKTIFVAAPVLKSIQNTNSGVELTWQAPAGASKYRVFRKTGNGSWTRIGLTTSTSYIDKTAVSGKTYSYTVRCTNASGSAYISAYNSNGLSITVVK